MNGLYDVKAAGNVEDYLADVISVWDCYGGCWRKGAPVILRFESQDVWVDADAGVAFALRTKGGSIVSGNAVERDFATDASEDDCLAWRTVPGLGAIVGRRRSVRQTLASLQHVLRKEGIDVPCMVQPQSSRSDKLSS